MAKANKNTSIMAPEQALLTELSQLIAKPAAGSFASQ